MAASTPPSATTSRRSSRPAARQTVHGGRNIASTSAAEAIRSQATPMASRWAKRSTANDGPR